MKKSENGFILLSILLSTMILTLMGVAALQIVSSNLRAANKEQSRVNAQFTADAGLDDAIRQLNQNASWTGQGQTTLLNTTKQRTTYQTTVTDGSTQFQKFINVTANTYTPGSSTTPSHTRKYNVEMRGVGSGSYSIVSGVGGLIMKNNSKILGGEVYVNGELSLSNSAQIGLSLLPVKVSVADQSCPLNGSSGYPRVCTAGERSSTQPITFAGNSRIYGQVQATNQTNGANMYSPGLVAGSPAAAPLPEYDRQDQINRATNNMTGTQASCSLGVKTWPANTKITGDVTVSGICVITVEGDVWITGNLNLSNAAIVIVKLGVTQQPVIMVDGNNGVTIRNAAGLMANINLSPVGFKVITYASTVACSTAASNACDVTGTNLYNSKNKVTVSIENAAAAAETEFYARWSKITINNSGNIGALVGQTVELSNAAAITFGTEVSGFSGPVAWVVNSYKRTY